MQTGGGPGWTRRAFPIDGIGARRHRGRGLRHISHHRQLLVLVNRPLTPHARGAMTVARQRQTRRARPCRATRRLANSSRPPSISRTGAGAGTGSACHVAVSSGLAAPK